MISYKILKGEEFVANINLINTEKDVCFIILQIYLKIFIFLFES